MYKRKTRDVFVLEVYCDGWEYEIAEYSRREINQRRKEYRENCPYPTRVRVVREPIPQNPNA